MEAILFYGDGGHRDEATRRQVRSVAAQYSHRIGPRKRKAVKRSKTEEQEDKYKKIASVPPGAAGDNDSGDAQSSGAVAAGPSRPPAYFPNHPQPPLAFVAQHPSHDAAHPESRPPGAPGSRPVPNASGQLRWQPRWQPVQFGPGVGEGAQRPVSEGHPQQQYHAAPPPHFPHPPPYHAHDPRQYQPQPPYQSERPDSSRAFQTPQSAPPHSGEHGAPRPQSQSASPSSGIRLPEYSWTEYPRYSPHHESFPSVTPSPERAKPHARHSSDLPRPSLPLPVPRRTEPPRSIPKHDGQPPVPSPTPDGLAPDVFLTGRKTLSNLDLRGSGTDREGDNTLTPIGQAAKGAARLEIVKVPGSELPPIATRPRSTNGERVERQDSSLGQPPS